MKIWKNLFGKNDKIHPDVIAMADYVVEQTNTYTKWNSGKLEMWVQATESVSPGNVTIVVELPVQMTGAYFNNSVIMATLYSSTGGWNSFDLKRAIPNNSTSINVSGINESNKTEEVTVYVYVKARWK